MRDARRIRPFLDNVAAVWEQCPDLRFGQFIMDVVPDNDRLWNCEEADFLSALKQFEEGHDFVRTSGMAANTDMINNLFVYGIAKGEYQLYLYMNSYDGKYYIEFGNQEKLFDGSYESRTLVKNMLMEFTKWMYFEEYLVNVSAFENGITNMSNGFKRGFESVGRAYAVFKIFAVGYISALPMEEFIPAMKFINGHLPEAVNRTADPELKRILAGIKGSYADFVIGMLEMIYRRPEKRKELIDYIETHPDTSSSDVVGYVSEWEKPEVEKNGES